MFILRVRIWTRLPEGGSSIDIKKSALVGQVLYLNNNNARHAQYNIL
jgi:hypothetical protein